MDLQIKIMDGKGNIRAEKKEQEEVMLVYQRYYQEGDRIVITSSEKNRYIKVQVDDALGSSLLYITGNEVVYNIPFGEKRSSYSPKVFIGELHSLWARVASKEEINEYKNLSLNVMDQHEAVGYYPHASANVETRGEAVFAARNAIDGVRENHSHGDWPYQSWGINRQDDARMKLDFGRTVIIDKIIMYTRADFPHDNWWKEVTLLFSDGSELQWELEKTDKAHVIYFDKKEVKWLELCKMLKSEDPSPFPALTQIEVYGVELAEN
ncbi:MAG: carbohydrate-binding protein [Mobilitalea sp.]